MSLIVSSGVSDLVVAGLPARNIVVEGGSVGIESGGIAINTRDDVGEVVVYSGGTASRTVVVGGQIGGEVGATLDIEEGGRSISATIGKNGTLIQQGGRSIDMIVATKDATIFNKAVAVGTRITAAGELDVEQSLVTSSVVTDGGNLSLTEATARDTQVSGRGSESLSENSRSFGTEVTSGGFELVGDGSVSVDAVIGSRGSEILGLYGSSIGTIIEGGGTETVFTSAVAQSTTVQSGGTVILEGGTFSGNIAGGGQEVVKGYMGIRPTSVTYNSLHVPENVELVIRSGGIAAQTVVQSGGTLIVSSGDTASSTVLAGGNEIVSNGGHITGTQIFGNGATLTIDSLKPSLLIISGFGTTNAIDFMTFAQGSAESLSAKYDAASQQTTVTLTDSASQAKIVLFGQYAAAGFELKPDDSTGSLLTYSASTSASSHDLTGSHR